MDVLELVQPEQRGFCGAGGEVDKAEIVERPLDDGKQHFAQEAFPAATAFQEQVVLHVVVRAWVGEEFSEQFSDFVHGKPRVVRQVGEQVEDDPADHIVCRFDGAVDTADEPPVLVVPADADTSIAPARPPCGPVADVAVEMVERDDLAAGRLHHPRLDEGFVDGDGAAGRHDAAADITL